MPTRLLEPVSQRNVIHNPLVFRSPRNWTPFVYFALLGGVHLFVCIYGFERGYAQGILSLILGMVFLLASVVALLVRYEVAVIPAQGRVLRRWGWRRLAYEQAVPFHRVRAVRFTVGSRSDRPRCLIEILYDHDAAECPPASDPFAQAVYLAMTMDVQLIKVMSEESASGPGPRHIR